MNFIKSIFLIIFILLPTLNYAIDDTKENRIKEAKRYAKVMPADELINDILRNMSKNYTDNEKARIKEFFSKAIDLEKMENLMINSMIEHFTADELKALADFYESDIGKSSMKKFGEYVADIFPQIQSMIYSAADSFYFKANTEIDSNQIRLYCIISETKTRADSIIQFLNNGDAFSDLAKKYSIGVTHFRGGDMGYLNPNDLIDDFKNTVQNLNPNEYSKIIMSDNRYFIFYRSD